MVAEVLCLQRIFLIWQLISGTTLRHFFEQCLEFLLATVDVGFHKCIHRSFLDVILSGGSSNCAALEILDELIGKQNIQ